MRRFTEGRYRTEKSEHRPARAYVIDGAKAYFLTEETTGPKHSGRPSRPSRPRTNITPKVSRSLPLISTQSRRTNSYLCAPL